MKLAQRDIKKQREQERMQALQPRSRSPSPKSSRTRVIPGQKFWSKNQRSRDPKREKRVLTVREHDRNRQPREARTQTPPRGPRLGERVPDPNFPGQYLFWHTCTCITYIMFVGYFIRYIGTFKIVPIDSKIGILVSDNLFCFKVSSNSPPSKDTDLKIYPVRKLPPSDQPAKEIERLQREMESYLQQIQVIEQRALRGKQSQFSFDIWILDQSAIVLKIYQSV